MLKIKKTKHLKLILECIFLRVKSSKNRSLFTVGNFCVSANILLLKNQIDDGKVGRWFRGKNFVLSPLLIGGARALKKRVIGWKSEKKFPLLPSSSSLSTLLYVENFWKLKRRLGGNYFSKKGSTRVLAICSAEREFWAGSEDEKGLFYSRSFLLKIRMAAIKVDELLE